MKLEGARVTNESGEGISEQTFEAPLEFCGFRHFSVWNRDFISAMMSLCGAGVCG